MSPCLSPAANATRPSGDPRLIHLTCMGSAYEGRLMPRTLFFSMEGDQNPGLGLIFHMEARQVKSDLRQPGLSLSVVPKGLPLRRTLTTILLLRSGWWWSTHWRSAMDVSRCPSRCVRMSPGNSAYSEIDFLATDLMRRPWSRSSVRPMFSGSG